MQQTFCVYIKKYGSLMHKHALSIKLTTTLTCCLYILGPDQRLEMTVKVSRLCLIWGNNPPPPPPTVSPHPCPLGSSQSITYRLNTLSPKMGTLTSRSSNSTPILFLSIYLIKAPALLICNNIGKISFIFYTVKHIPIVSKFDAPNTWTEHNNIQGQINPHSFLPVKWRSSPPHTNYHTAQELYDIGKWLTILTLSNGTSELMWISLSLSVKCCGIPGRPFKAMMRLLQTSKALTTKYEYAH